MANYSMKRKVEKGEAIDVSSFEKTEDGQYILDTAPVFGIDYCDLIEEIWIWSIALHISTNKYHASPYLNKHFDGSVYKYPEWIR